MNWDYLHHIARVIAEEAHKGQLDKAGRPYIEHPLAVAAMLEAPLAKVVALLHDILEDSDIYTADDLRKAGFPQEVIEAVCTITRRSGESRRHYIYRVKENPLATKVKLADLSHNMYLSRLRCVTEKDIKRTEMYRKEFEFLAQ